MVMDYEIHNSPSQSQIDRGISSIIGSLASQKWEKQVNQNQGTCT